MARSSAVALLLVLVAVPTVACGSSGGALPDGGATPLVDASGATCSSVAATLCERAAACGDGGTLGVLEPGGIVTISYGSLAFCKSTFSSQCGPDAASTDYPLVRSAARCDEALASASCEKGALLLPTACQ